MTEYIEKEKVLAILERTLNAFEDEGDKNAAMAVDMLAFEIKELPAADVAPVAHDCPQCGARMDGEHHD